MKILSELISIAEEVAADTAERHAREGAAFGKDVKAGKHAKLTDDECKKYSPSFVKAYKAALNEERGRYTSFASWKAACRKADGTCWIDGDKDIAQAMVGPKPFKRGETFSIGEWDGAEGEVFPRPGSKISEAKGDKDDVSYTHSRDCDWKRGGDCDCGKKTRDHASHCLYKYGKDCDCGMSYRASYSEAVELDEAGPKPWAEGTEAWELGKKHSMDGKGSCPYPADSKLGKKYWAGFTEGTATKKRLKDQGKTNESADLAKALVRGEKAPKGIMNKIDHWLGKLMIEKDKNRFVPAEYALKGLRTHGFSEQQITKIRDAAMDSALTAVQTMQRKHGDKVPANYISKLPSSFGVFDLFLNVSEEIHREYAELMRKLFDAKIEKIKDDLDLPKVAIKKAQEASMRGDWKAAKRSFDAYDLKESDESRRAFKRRELEVELGHEDREQNRTFAYVKYGIEIDGKLWMRDGKPVDFRSKATAEKSAATIAGRGKKTKVVPLTEDANLQSLGKDLTTKAVAKSRASEQPLAGDEEVPAEETAVNTPPAEKTEADEAPVFKEGDKVKPLTGPHKGEVHTVTKVLANGSLDIVPDQSENVKYAKGGANARPEQVELAEITEAVKPLSLFKKGSLFSQVLAGVQLVEKVAK